MRILFNIFPLVLDIQSYIGKLKENWKIVLILIFSVYTDFSLHLFFVFNTMRTLDADSAKELSL